MLASSGQRRSFSKARSSWPWLWNASPSMRLLSLLSTSARCLSRSVTPKRFTVITRWPDATSSAGTARCEPQRPAAHGDELGAEQAHDEREAEQRGGRRAQPRQREGQIERERGASSPSSTARAHGGRT